MLITVTVVTLQALTPLVEARVITSAEATEFLDHTVMPALNEVATGSGTLPSINT